MNNISIRLFTKGDVEFAYESCKNEHWNHSSRSIERMLGYEPKGCFVAEVDRKRVGHVFSICYGKVGWIGFLIVNKKYRRIGVGTLLMKKAIGYLQDNGVETIKLDAVPEIADLYRKLGFVDEFESLRFMRINKNGTYTVSTNISPLKRDDLRKTAVFDSHYFGANRLKVLSELYEDSPEHCFISHAGSNIAGYIMFYEAERGYRIGPWVCDPAYSSTAKELVIKCMETLENNTEVYIGVPAANNLAVRILQDLGFNQFSRSIRMHFGEKLNTERLEGVFAIGGAEKG